MSKAKIDWDFGREKEPLIHRIHSYPAKFPAFITTEALRYAERKGVKVRTIADVFCGCGTTAVEARRNEKNFWGCDINPVAILIAQVKSRSYNDRTLQKHFVKIVSRYGRTRISQRSILKVNNRIKYWFEEEKIEDLLKLKKAILREVPVCSPYRNFFLCAFSNILKSSSKWLTKSIKPQIDPNKYQGMTTMELFKGQFEFMKNANKCNKFPAGIKNSISVKKRNFLSMRFNKPIADLIVTSPPYVSSYDYADIHQLSTLWLNYFSDYRDLRKNMMGNHYQMNPLSESNIKNLGEIGKEIYNNLVKVDKHKATSTARYFIDIERTAEKCWDMLNKNGMAFFIIGNTEYKGVKIDNAEYLRECMKKANFKETRLIERKISSKTLTPYRDSKGRFTRDSTKRKVYAKEFVVVGKKK